MQKHNRPAGHILLAVLFFAALPLFGSCAQRPHKVYRVGIISGSDAFIDIAEGFKSKMKELGYIEGKNISYDLRKTNFEPLLEELILKGFVADKVDLIFAFPTEPALMAKMAARESKIPVVFAMAGVEESNLVENVRNPGGNITGVRFPNPELTAKRFEFLLEFVPRAKRVYLIYDRNYPTNLFALEALYNTAPSLGVTLVKDPVDNIEGLRSVLSKRAGLGNPGIDAILLMPDILNNSPEGFKEIIDFAHNCNLPVGGGLDFTADMGAVFSFVPGNIDQGILAAGLADKIFRGMPAGSIPVVTPEARLRINYKVIRSLGLEVNEAVLSRADEIIR
ncbi:MAG: ABC transporter substrate-binding protein [Candidatus Omnitrophota bacterium]|jgi:putative ABC transport system substrate-binding protein